MNKNNKTALMPRLRFPEFLETGEWKACTLNELAIRITTRNQDKSIKRVLTNSAIDGVTDQSDYFDREVANQNNLGNYLVINVDDYVYNPRISTTAPVGPISKNKVGKGVISPLYTVFRFKNDANDFYEQYFKTNRWHSYLKNVSNVGARHDRMSISNDSFMKMPLPYHLEKEQEKIADCLSSLDALIIIEAKKLETLNAHKKGLMQKIFPAEGQTIPEWRFPEFRGDGEWVISSLGSKTIKVGSGSTPLGGENNYKKNGRPFIRSQNVGWGHLILDDIAFIDEYTHQASTSTEVLTGDMLLNITGASIGRSAVADCRVNGGNVNQHVCIIRTIADELSPWFLSQYFLSAYGQKQIENFQAGGNRQGLNFAQIRSFAVPIPSKIEEQKKITDCLSSLDELITAQADKIEALKTHKKGLMQGLFPSIEEVSE